MVLKVLEEIEMIQVKQRPYAADRDKTRFHVTLPERLTFGNADNASPSVKKQSGVLVDER